MLNGQWHGISVNLVTTTKDYNQWKFQIMYILETFFGIRWTFKIGTIVSMFFFFSLSLHSSLVVIYGGSHLHNKCCLSQKCLQCKSLSLHNYSPWIICYAMNCKAPSYLFTQIVAYLFPIKIYHFENHEQNVFEQNLH